MPDLLAAAPMQLNLSLIGFGEHRWRDIAHTSRDVFGVQADSSAFPAVVERMAVINDELCQTIAARRSNPTGDVVSAAAEPVGGRLLSDEEVLAVLMSLVYGGSDTTGTLVASALCWLDRHPEHRQSLAENELLRASATDEFLRMFPPNHTLARSAVADIEIGGRLIHAGDQVLMSWAAANRDPSVFPNPDDVVLDRAPNHHTAFGLGVHHCIGSHMAKMEFGVLLERILTRLTDYRIDWDGVVTFENVGTLCGYLALPAAFTPGPRVGDASER